MKKIYTTLKIICNIITTISFIIGYIVVKFVETDSIAFGSAALYIGISMFIAVVTIILGQYFKYSEEYYEEDV